MWCFGTQYCLQLISTKNWTLNTFRVHVLPYSSTPQCMPVSKHVSKCSSNVYESSFYFFSKINWNIKLKSQDSLHIKEVT